MIPLKKRLQQMQQSKKLPWEALERDYLFSAVLAAIGLSAPLQGTLIFKGGACLKKFYFGKYRLSEDLDFSTLEGAPQGEALELAVQEVCRSVEELLRPLGQVKLQCTRYLEREPHPHGQEAFIIRARLPWHSDFHTKVMIEISREETLVCLPQKRNLLHEYGDEIQGTLAVYALEEIVAEKLRAILQQVARADQRSWVRPRARDYYDLWKILGSHPEILEIPDFRQLLRAKCQPKGVDFIGPESFFPTVMMEAVERTWSNWMGPLVSELPPWNQVRNELQPLIERLLS